MRSRKPLETMIIEKCTCLFGFFVKTCLKTGQDGIEYIEYITLPRSNQAQFSI